MKLQLLESTFENGRSASAGQHLTCFILDDRVALDAGSLGISVSDDQRRTVRDIILTHAHLDHVAGLPLYIDDLFAILTEPVRIYALPEVIEILEHDLFNWRIYPRFSELRNHHGPVMEYREFHPGQSFRVAGLEFLPVPVNHKVPTAGFVISGETGRIAVTGDTAAMDAFWPVVNREEYLDALVIECAFPEALAELADISHHLTPSRMFTELEKFEHNCPVYVSNMKPMYRDSIRREIDERKTDGVEILEVGKCYVF